MVSLEQIIRYKYLPIRTKLSFLDQSKQDLAIKAFQSLEGAYFPTEVEHFYFMKEIYRKIVVLLYGPQTDFKKNMAR